MTDNTEAMPPHPSHDTVRDWMPVSEALRLADLWTVGDLDNSGQWRAAIKVLADEVRAALAQRQQVPEQRLDGMPASADERYLRRLLAVRSGIFGAYFDDGEAQGQEHGIVIDFMREPVADIDAKLRALNVARAALAAAPSAQAEPDEWQYKLWDEEDGWGVWRWLPRNDLPQFRRLAAEQPNRWQLRALYAAPPTAQAEPQVPLTDEQIAEFGALCVMNRRTKKTARELLAEYREELARGIGKQESK